MIAFEHPLVFIDCEMSGTNPDKHQLLELDAKICQQTYPFTFIDSFHRYIGSPEGGDIEKVLKDGNPISLEKNGLDNKVELLRISPPPTKVVTEFSRWLPNNYILVGFNLHLDYQFLKKASQEAYESGLAGRKLSWRFIDLMSLTEVIRASYGDLGGILRMNSYSLSGLCRNFGLNTDGAHTASGDSEMCIQLFRHYISIMNDI